jgi:glucosylceramidase
MVFDHNRASVAQWANEIFNHPTASQYVDGIAFHWYDWARFMDGVAFHERLNDTHHVDPNRFMLATESCNCPGVATKDDAWFRGQRYAHDMITDFNNWVSGWVDWNLILDHQGGPNHLNNTCDAPIIIDETEENYFIQPMYYFIQHFSKYVPPGSKRVHTEVAVKYKQPGVSQLLTQYPSGLYTCDSSSRQNLVRSEESKLSVNGTIFCLFMREVPWQGNQVELIPCDGTNQTWTFEENGQIHIDDDCLGLNHGSTDYGARIMVQKCVAQESAAQHQRWRFEDGEMKPAMSDKCVTAGYPFAQAAAFVTPENKKVMVVLNENTEPAEFDIDVGDRSVSTSVPGGGIRTFVWE